MTYPGGERMESGRFSEIQKGLLLVPQIGHIIVGILLCVSSIPFDLFCVCLVNLPWLEMPVTCTALIDLIWVSTHSISLSLLHEGYRNEMDDAQFGQHIVLPDGFGRQPGSILWLSVPVVYVHPAFFLVPSSLGYLTLGLSSLSTNAVIHSKMDFLRFPKKGTIR